jgi:hypothetical protein
MTQIVLIGLDVAKHVFQLHAVAADGRVVCRRQVRRPILTTLLMSIPSCRIAMGRRSCPGEWCSWVIAKPLASAPSNVL